VWIGNVTRDPELKYLESGKAICSAGLAINNRVRDAQGNWTDGEPTWFNLTIWEDQGENFAASVSKGTRVIIKGRLDQRSYTTKEGVPGTSLDITVEEWGASGRWATMEVSRTARKDGGAPAMAGNAPSAADLDEPF